MLKQSLTVYKPFSSHSSFLSPQTPNERCKVTCPHDRAATQCSHKALPQSQLYASETDLIRVSTGCQNSCFIQFLKFNCPDFFFPTKAPVKCLDLLLLFFFPREFTYWSTSHRQELYVQGTWSFKAAWWCNETFWPNSTPDLRTPPKQRGGPLRGRISS